MQTDPMWPYQTTPAYRTRVNRTSSHQRARTRWPPVPGRILRYEVIPQMKVTQEDQSRFWSLGGSIPEDENSMVTNKSDAIDGEGTAAGLVDWSASPGQHAMHPELLNNTHNIITVFQEKILSRAYQGNIFWGLVDSINCNFSTIRRSTCISFLKLINT